MIVAACVDDNMGMTFNGRRQSRDRFLCRRIADKAADRLIWLSEYSAPLFAEISSAHIQVDDDFWRHAGAGDICFAESGAFAAAVRDIEEIWLYRWNRSYPGDTFFPVDLTDWKLVRAVDFSGYSHQIITEEIYKR